MRRFFPKASHNTDSTQDVPQDVGDKLERFRILIVGRASAGKTTLLQRVCNTTEYPQVFDSNGIEVWLAFHVASNLLLIVRDQIDATVVKSSIDVCTHARIVAKVLDILLTSTSADNRTSKTN
jgi:hypothetical protein